MNTETTEVRSQKPEARSQPTFDLRPLTSRISPIFTPPAEQDLLDLAADIRPADAAEIAAGIGIPVPDAVRISVATSDVCIAARIDGRLVAIFGICPVSIMDRSACVWALGTRRVDLDWRTFARHSRPALRMLADAMPWAETFQNIVHAENEAAVRWLGWLGAAFGSPFLVQPAGRPPSAFKPFCIERSDLYV